MGPSGVHCKVTKYLRLWQTISWRLAEYPYIKQVKVRAGAFEYGAENVIVSEITKEGSWLHFRNIGYATEREHLKEQTEKDISSFDDRVKELRADGKSIREIADSLGVSKSKIGNIIKKLNL